MEHLSVQAALRGKESKGEMARMRQTGKIPVSLSGRGMEPVSLYVTAADVRRILNAETGMNTLIDISFDGGRHVARVAQIEQDRIKNSILSLSLQKIATNEPQKATIPLEITGEPEAVRLGDGMVTTLLHSLDVRALPERMVGSLTADVSELHVGEAMKAGDVPLPRGFELLTDPDALVVTIQAAFAPAAEEPTPEATPTENAAEQSAGE